MKPKARSYKRKAKNQTLDEAVRNLDTLARYDEWCQDILPALQQDLRSGMDAKKLREKYLADVTARQITIALTAPAEKANAAIRDLVDRAEGRAVEKKEISHRLEKLKDEQLDAMLLTELEELSRQPN